MTSEQKAAYINSQTACAMIEAMAYHAENTQRTETGQSIAYGHDAFLQIPSKYGIHHNQVMELINK